MASVDNPDTMRGRDRLAAEPVPVSPHMTEDGRNTGRNNHMTLHLRPSGGHTAAGRRTALLGAVVVAVLAFALPAPAGTESPPPHESPDAPTTRDNPALASFNESEGCGPLQGVRGPYAIERGYLGDSEPIRGPWGDFYGRTVGLVRSQLVAVHMPMTDASWHVFWVHERVAPALEQAAQNLLDAQATGKHYTIRASHSWSFHPATVPPGRHMSFHAVGAAFDINSDTNPYRGDNVLVTDMPRWFVRAFTDAGFCWGGDWQSIKDPMHFSWMGPAHTPGHDQPALQPASTEENRKFRTEVDLTTAGDTSAAGLAVPVVADFDRDGAGDLGRVTQGTLAGHGTLTFSQAHHAYESCLTTATVRTTFTEAIRIPLAQDFTGDGRPDLAFVDTGGETLRLYVHRWERMDGRRRRTTTAIPSTGVIAVRAADVDADGATDLIVHRDLGSRTRIEVWAGPDMADRTAKRRVRSTITDPLLASGDENLDSRIDVYLLGSDGKLQIMYGPDLSATKRRNTTVIPAAGEHLYVHDYDGDGRRDLWLTSGDLSARVFLGGKRSRSADLDYWFVEDTVHWSPGQGCHPVAGADFDAVAIDGLPDGLAAAAPSPAGHSVTAPNDPGRSGWSRDLPGTAVTVAASPDGALVADVAVVDGRGRITAFAGDSGHRLWVTGMPSGAVPVAGWTDGTTVTVVSRTDDGATDIQTYADGARTSRRTLSGIAPAHAAGHGDAIAVLGTDGEGATVLALAAGGTLTTAAALPGEPIWIGATPDRVAVVTGLAPTRLTVFDTDGAGGLDRLGRTRLGRALIVAGDMPSSDQAVFAMRKAGGRTIAIAVDLTTMAKTRLGRTPYDHEPVGVDVSGAEVTVAVQRITDGAWRLVDLGL